jgi:regulator of RNase E activity RraA
LRLSIIQINVPVKLQSDEQDAVIRPGDYLIGDLNGVVCLPKDLAEKVIPLMGPQVEADKKTGLELDRGMTFVEASKKHRGGLRKA